MDHPRRFKPFWRWELFLFAFVLALSMLASVVVRVDWGAWGAALTVLLLVLGVAAALLLVVPLFLTSGRDSEGSRRSLEGVALVPLPESGDRRIRLEETHRRQTAIEAAVAKTHGGLRAVLTPDASRWLGRELRVGVELVDDGGAIHRVGFLPREVGVEVEPRLRALESAGQAATLPAVVPDVHRPFTVELRL